jgi:hypothetical protein
MFRERRHIMNKNGMGPYSYCDFALKGFRTPDLKLTKLALYH